MTSLVVVEAGLSNPSSTRLLADRLTAAAERSLEERTGREPSVHRISLRELAHPLADNLLTGFASGPLVPALEAVAGADALIVVTPVFSGSFSGLFKTFFDVLEPGVLRGKPVLLAATAGTARHQLVLDHALRPLLSYLGAVTAPTGVFAAADDWAGSGVDALEDRIARAAGDLAVLVGGVAAIGAPSPAPRQDERDDLANSGADGAHGQTALTVPTDFSEQLAALGR